MKLQEQIDKIRQLSGIKESVNQQPTVWYRGTGGNGEFNGNDNDELGPGIYFSSLLDDAKRYGPDIQQVEFIGKFVPNKKYPKLKSQLTWLIKQCNDWKGQAQNWDENPATGLRMAVDSCIQYNDTPADCFQQVWVDFFRYNSPGFISNVGKLYDAMYIAKNMGVFHMVVWNKESLKTI